MDDLSTLSRALREAANPKGGGDGSFIDLVEKYLHSSDLGVRIAVAETLREILISVDEEGKRNLLEDSALGLLPALIPLIPDCAIARTVVNTIVDYAKPKEILLALSDVLSHIEEEATAGDAMSEDETEVEETSGEDLITQLGVVLECHSSVIPRLNLSRSTPMLLSLTDSLSNVLPTIVSDVDVHSARHLLSSLSELVSIAWKWVGTTSDTGGEQRAMLTQLLYQGVTLLSPRIEAKLAERWFFGTFPRYSGLHKDDGVWRSAQLTLGRVTVVASELGLSQPKLVDTLTHPTSTSPYSSLAALTLLVSSLPPLSSNSVDVAVNLEDCMPVLTAALSSSAIDAALTFTWHLVNHARTTIAFDTVTMLIELLTPLAAMPPTPTSRTLILKLIGQLISLSRPPDQVLLFKQLLEPANPFEQIRVQALSLLRDAIAAPNPLIIHPSLLEHLSPILFTIPASSSSTVPIASLAHLLPRGSDAPPLQLSKTEVVDTMYPAWFTDSANVLRLLIQRDEGNVSGVRQGLQETMTNWVHPQLTRLEQLQSQGGGEAQVNFVLDRWQDALERLRETIVTCQS